MRLHLIAALLVLAGCSRTTEGPTPSITGTINPRQRNTAPARMCNAQGDERGWRLELLGERFTPVPQDVLTDTPTVGMPEVTLKGPVTLTLDRDRVSYRDSTLLLLDIPTRDTTPPAELPEGTYAVSVRNLGGGTAELADQLIVVPPPVVTRVTAPQGFTFVAPSPLVIEGTGFQPNTFPAMRLTRAGFPDVELFTTTVESPTRLLTELPEGTPEGTYDLELTNPEGCSFTLPGALTITYSQLGLLTIEPRFGWQRRNQAITIHNAPTGDQRAFAGGSPEAFLVAPLKTAPSEMVDIPLNRVAFVSSTIITAVVPTCSGNEALPLTAADCPTGIVPGGPYALKVADTSGAVGSVPAASGFTVLRSEPPVIDSISPSAIDTRGLDATTPLVVTGRSFGTGAKVQLLKQLATGNVLACELPATGTASATSLSARVPPLIAAAQCAEFTTTGTQVAATADLQLTAGLFVVRVQNTADPAYANYSGLIVTNPAANPTPGPALQTRLATARADFPLVLATDELGQPFLYALGGTDGTNTLASVEVAPVTLFGDVGGTCTGPTCTFHTLERTPLGVGTEGETPEPRRGLTAVVRTVPNDTSYVFVLGGVRSDGTALSTVERAQVLKLSDAPALTPPERLTQEGTALPPGTWYYRVSAVLGASDPENPNGETLPSDEHPVKSNAALNVARLTWTCVPGAVKYRVYRTATVNETSGAERLLEEIPAPTTPACTGSPLPQVSYTDTGSKAPAANAPRPLPPGALGRWVRTNMPQLTVERGNAAARVAGDSVYVSGGFCSTAGGNCPSSAGALLSSVERATFNGPQLGAFAVAGNMTRARQRHSLAFADASTAPGSFTPAAPDNAQDAWLLAVGGDAGGAPLSGTGIIEVAQVRNSGGPIATPAFSAATYNTAGTHGGWAEVIANYLFQAGSTGGTGFKLNSGFVCPGNGNDPGKCLAATSFDGTLGSSAINAYQQGGPRYLAGSTLFRAFIYAAGGFPNDAGGTPTNTLERIIY
ncbi:hypothetical protein [Hyalangium gracile]|uniref:hypothetical protein n=1 Tax=Hyalangium gracile TaxID=394092 RepID=UPI001CC903EC|nr:hypothetical protein [Hyalangium gracile]